MKFFEKMYIVFIALMLVMYFMPAGFADTDDSMVRNAVEDNDNTARVSVGSITVSDESRIARCVTFISNNKLDERPKVICARLLNKELDCVKYLAGKEIAEPEAKCDAFFRIAAVTEKRVAAAQNTRADVSVIRAKIAERVSRERPENKDFVEKLAEDKVRVFSNLPRAEQNTIMELGESERMEKLSRYTIKTVKKDMLFKKRDIAKEKLDEAKRKYELAKKEYVKVNKAYNEKKKEFNAAKKNLQECEKEGNKSAGCEEIREQTLEHAKEYVINGAQMAIEHLEKIKNKAESAEGMEQEKADEIIANIDETIAKIESAVLKVKDSQTKEEVREGAKEIADAWRHIKNAEKVYAERIVHSTMWNIIKKSEVLERRMENARDRIEEYGKDVSGLDEKITEFSEKISEAKKKFNESEELLKEAQELRKGNATSDEIRQKVSEANAKLREAHNDIKEAYRIFASIIMEINASGGKITDDEDDVVEVVEEEDDDDEDETEEEEEETDEGEDDDEGSGSGDNQNETSEDTDSGTINETG